MAKAQGVIVGFDPSTTKFGVCFGGPDSAAPKAFVYPLPGAADHVFDSTLRRASDSISELCRMVGATHVVIEAPIIVSERSAHTMVALMQLTGAVRAAAARADCHIKLVASSTVRKHFLGHGRPDDPKRAVLERCRSLRWQVSDDNAADACAVWAWGMAQYFPRWQFAPPPPTALFGSRAA